MTDNDILAAALRAAESNACARRSEKALPPPVAALEVVIAGLMAREAVKTLAPGIAAASGVLRGGDAPAAAAQARQDTDAPAPHALDADQRAAIRISAALLTSIERQRRPLDAERAGALEERLCTALAAAAVRLVSVRAAQAA